MELESLLTGAGHDVVYRSLKEADWTDVLCEVRDLIVVAGGDGSVRKVFTALGESPTTVTLFPTGSANNIARTLGFETDVPGRLLAGWEPGVRRTYDIWEVETRWGRQPFVETFGGGIFADVLIRADSQDDENGEGKVDRGLRLLTEVLAEAIPLVLELEIDGEHIHEELLGIEAMNVRELGPNLLLAPEADPGDGLLDFVVLRSDDRSDLADYLEARLRNEEVEHPRLVTRRGGRLAVKSPAGCRHHVDDELLQPQNPEVALEACVRAAAVRMEVLVPASV